MRGDFSRGHNPDGRRGQHFRRVLLQQGRLLLDSDFNATVDALVEADRTAVAALGCRAGSPDLGYLVTPGRLLWVNESPTPPAVTAGTADVFADFSRRYLGRFPSLHVGATGGAAATLRLPLRQAFDQSASTTLTAWLQSDQPATIRINGIPASVAPTSPDDFQPVLINAAALGQFDALLVEVSFGDAIRIGLVEQAEFAGTEPAFWIARGTYHIDGLIVEATADLPFPDASFSPDAGFQLTSPSASPSAFDGVLLPTPASAGDRFVVYLEIWERHLSAAEAPAIREEALGGAIDTTTRSAVVGQVKIAPLTATGSPPSLPGTDAISAAFGSVAHGAGLTLNITERTVDPDPCALPELSGYTGRDNRLYRIEVHRGGPLSAVQLKWSRDNASMLVSAGLDEQGMLVFPAGTPLTSGDLVEVLNEVVDLSDSALGHIDSAFTPPTRATGILVALIAIDTATTSGDLVFRMVDPFDTAVAVTLDGRYGDIDAAPLRLRLWHGLIDPQRLATDAGSALSAGPHAVEDGISVTFDASGIWHAGDYWQYEARARRENANGAWISTPHGPERRFAPLAIVEYLGASQPLSLVAWLDQRFPRLCELAADDIAFLGGAVESESTTVQEALEELFRQPIIEASCGELIIRPEDDIQAVFNSIPNGGDARVCLHPGTWGLTQTVVVVGKGDITLSGAGRATRLESANRMEVLRFSGCASVTVRDLEVASLPQGSGGTQIAIAGGALGFVDCPNVTVEHCRIERGANPAASGSAIRVAVLAANVPSVDVRLRDNTLAVGHQQAGILIINAASADVTGNLVAVPANSLNIPGTLAGQGAAAIDLAAAIGNVLIDPLNTAPPNFDDEIFTSGPVVPFGTDGAGRPQIAAALSNGTVIFSTHPLLGTAAGAQVWGAVFTANPPGTTNGTQNAVEGYHRRLKNGLARRMFGVGAGATIPPAAAPLLTQVTQLVTRSAPVISGLRGITIGGDRGRVPTGPETDLAANPRTPAVHVADNRVIGFRQGIHVALRRPGLGTGPAGRRQAYNVRVENNVVHLRAPLFARERHGVFVGGAQTVLVRGNQLELTHPIPSATELTQMILTPPLDGIRLRGVFGALVQLRENHLVNLPTGIRFVEQPAQTGTLARSAADNGFTNVAVPRVGL